MIKRERMTMGFRLFLSAIVPTKYEERLKAMALVVRMRLIYQAFRPSSSPLVDTKAERMPNAKRAANPKSR